MLIRLIVIASLLGAAALAYRWWQGREGRVTVTDRPGSLSSKTLGAQRGAQATFVQFSTPICAKCPPTKELLQRIAAESPHVAHIEIDASERLDLARELNIMRTPTTLVLDSDGLVVARISGAPNEAQAREALATVPAASTDYTI